MIRIEDLKIDSQYSITQNIYEGDIIYFYCRDNNVIKSLFLYLSGINKTNSVYFNNQIVYDNSQYFKQRIYISCEQQIIKTIYPKQIINSIQSKYNLKCNYETLQKLIDVLAIREECQMTLKNPFTLVGNTLINFAILQSLDNPIIFVNNPTIYLDNPKHIEYIVNTLNSHSYKTKLIGINRLSHFKDKIEQIIVFNDYGRTIRFNPKKVRICLIKGEKEKLLELIKDYERLFFIEKEDSFQLVFIDNLDHTTQKELNKLKYKIQKVSFYEIEKYF